ncbi:MAG: helix-turn-helix domain-containing protein [Betaproteobacteria bacterium]|jgi:predicted DNA binding protein
MRRLILEVSEKELIKAGIELPPLMTIKSLELLYFLRQNAEEFAAISRVEFKDATTKIQDLLTGGFLSDAQVIEREKNGAYIVFIRSGPSLTSVLNYIGIEGGYLFPPLGIGDGKVKFSFLGSEQQIKQFMETIDAIAIRYRVVLLAEADFSPVSVLNQLTQKQREVLVAAYKMGYYDIPRKITSEQLARSLNLVDSTVVEHIRKAEQRLITHILTSEAQLSFS